MSYIKKSINEEHVDYIELRGKVEKIYKDFTIISDKTLADIIETYEEERKIFKEKKFRRIINLKKVADSTYENLKKEYSKLLLIIENLLSINRCCNINLAIKKPFFKLVKDRSLEPLLLFANFECELDGAIKSLKIIGIDSIDIKGKGYFDSYLEANVHLINQYSKGIIAFLSKIDIKRQYRRGRGSLIMDFLEEEILPEVDKYMREYYLKSSYLEEYGKINSIGGYIASISYTTIEENISFYKSLGYHIDKKNISKNFNIK